MNSQTKRIKVETPSSSDEESDFSMSSECSDKRKKELMSIEDLLQEIEEQQAVEKSDECYYQEKEFKVGHWVLVVFTTKKARVHFVGQVTKISDVGDPEVVFLRLFKTTNQGTIFHWPESRDETEVSSEDIITVLPEPILGRRGELIFGVSFNSYNLK